MANGLSWSLSPPGGGSGGGGRHVSARPGAALPHVGDLSATAKNTTALGILHVWFNYAAASFFKELGIYLSREAKESDG